MRKRILQISLAVAVATAALAGYARYSTKESMTLAATHLLNSLTDEQKAKAMATLDKNGDELSFWHYVPTENLLQTQKRGRVGLTIVEMTAPQRHLLHALLSSALSQRGYNKAVNIMSLDDILRIQEKDTTGRRNSDKYFLTIFGEPSDTAPWAMRFEGHHLSLHFTVVKGQIAASPTFLGTNPAEVREGPRKGLRVLGIEEEMGRDLYKSLTPEQKKAALIDPKAYNDILTEASRKAALKGKPSGLMASKLNAKQKEMLQTLLEEYANNLPGDLAAIRLQQIKAAGNNLHFAWAGEAERGQPHYYRVQADAFLVEYDNVQNGANHVHSVWRDMKSDFGEDLLAQHYVASPHVVAANFRR
ncbi:MAG: DUF3500 domain-containing protein [Bryobacteraceae bacterium]|nr:DUF3500 domain-containing protein [Bryobacteraceae bacterium]